MRSNKRLIPSTRTEGIKTRRDKVASDEASDEKGEKDAKNSYNGEFYSKRQ